MEQKPDETLRIWEILQIISASIGFFVAVCNAILFHIHMIDMQAFGNLAFVFFLFAIIIPVLFEYLNRR